MPGENKEAVNVTEKQQPSRKRRRKRWGDAPPPPPPATTESSSAATAPANETTTTTSQVTATTATSAEDARAKALALQESIRQRLAALKQQQGTTAAASDLKRPASAVSAAAAADQQQQQESARPVKKAKHYELDLSTTGPTFKSDQQRAPKKKVNPYLAHLEQEEAAADHDHEASQVASLSKEQQQEDEDERLVSRTSKKRAKHKSFSFVEPGTFVEIAERKRQKAANALESGFVSGRKTGKFVHASDMASIYGSAGDVDQDASEFAVRADMDPQISMPQVMEWWDVELLPSKLKKQVANQEGKALSKQTKAQLQQLKSDSADDESKSEANTDDAELRKRCYEQASLSYSKTAELVQHIVPVKTGRTGPPPQPTLYLTKKERKRQRKLRREERQRELQDMQAAGLIPPPEPRLTLRNFIQVLGDQAFLDPSQMEQKVVDQMQARQRAHMERNEANRLTKEQRSEKRKKKLSEDTSQGVTVALFWVKDMSHPYHRAKLDLNAQQNNLTGGVLECEHPSVACVIVEGGPKAIKRYTRLMTVRMKWAGTDDAGSEDEEEGGDGEAVTHKFNPDNKCELVWTGMGAKRLFKGFIFQSCETSDVARKVLAAKGVGHFWDQVLSVASGRGESFNLKLATDDDDDNDVEMKES